MAAILIDGLSHTESSVQTAIRAVELLRILAVFISTILMFKGAIESSCSYDMVLSTLRKPWFYFRSWLSSPFYICIIMNLIVVLIAACSLLHHHNLDNIGDAVSVSGTDQNDDFQISMPPSLSPPPAAPPPMQNNYHENEKKTSAPPPAAAATISFENHHYREIWQDAEVQNCTLTSDSWTEAKEIEKAESLDSSAKVATARKRAQPTTAKKGQTKANEKQRQHEPSQEQLETKNVEGDETMEAAWRATTIEGAKPQNKQLKKSETWPQPPRVSPAQENIELEESELPSATATKGLKKYMTFNDTVSIRCRGGLIRDPSMSLEEFNGRVEAFIKNFNNEMRLQRQESEQRYLNMLNHSL